MALLKTVFEVNLTLFGKREGEKCVFFPFQSKSAATARVIPARPVD